MSNKVSSEIHRLLVERWANEQPDLLKGWHVVLSTKGSFIIKWNHPEFGTEFILARVRIGADQYVEVERDFRSKVAELLTTPQGFEREARVFNAIRELSNARPKWFVELHRVNHFLDRRGVDGLAEILVREDEATLKLPIQIKSTTLDRERFYERYPTYRDIVNVIIVRKEDTSQLLQSKLFSALGVTRSRMIKENITVAQMKARIAAVLQAA